MPLKISYQIPTLKLTSSTTKDPRQLYQALVDYSNDVQSYLQKLASSSNQNFVQDDKDISALQTLKPAVVAQDGMLTLPNGIIIQWMVGTGNNPGVSNLLPAKFPNAIFAAFAQASGAAVALEAALTDTSHVTVTTAAAGVQNCFIFAIGH